MASIPTWDPDLVLCAHVAEEAQTLFSTAVKSETGMDFRSPRAALIGGGGAIHLQVPSANQQQTLAQSGMILRIHPISPDWKAWPEAGAQFRYREYDMCLAQFLSPAQVAAGRGGTFVGVSGVSLRFALRLGPRRCSHTPAKGKEGVWSECPGRLAQ